ncbi:hypothetical protein Sta7437_3203 [Stanieria cyanosphaera PCC 7437]|uniref:Ferritin-like domain-containing protein n=1 Tax=Stanieria cyanosphaera (strain ATCC 29371 / PCC 7437) TaxID=111780 RepID=K9XVU4_STAC7|nr:hypothetical protein [Stanieria cyanosphaera]AFZ36710.1 hypothetical protein Sta7437_3203 [Stanieria cyanosphaera PCC 7437]
MNQLINPIDLAGEICFCPNFFQTKNRINYLIDQYLNLEKLQSHLEDLPQQFINPQPRSWQTINWQTINQEQIIGIDLNVFLAIVQGALNTEAPIRGYTQTSRQYLASIHPEMAKFVGGVVAQNGTMLELGLWEKEERQHTPALSKIYRQLTNQAIILDIPIPRQYHLSENPYSDLYRHGLHRIATEYSAVCLYLWMMARTTGTIQQVLQELLQDEINHMTKFWGFGKWLYSNFESQKLEDWLANQNKRYSCRSNQQRSFLALTITVKRMMKVLHWQSWSLIHKMELAYTFAWVFQRVWSWSNNLSSEYLEKLFVLSPNSGNITIDY